jgi:TRAP-type uncharacterized transport system substrate-binding protein
VEENMQRTSFARLTAVATAVVLSAGATAGFAQDDREGWPESFTVGTASQGGTYFAYGSGWANLVQKSSAFPAAAKSPAARCRTWRWSTPAMRSSA